MFIDFKATFTFILNLACIDTGGQRNTLHEALMKRRLIYQLTDNLTCLKLKNVHGTTPSFIIYSSSVCTDS